MKKTIILIALIIAVSINIFGQTNEDSTRKDNDPKEIIALAAELNKAKISLDVPALERIIADDYKIVLPVEGEITKSRLIEIYKEIHKAPLSPGERFVSYTSSETQVMFYGDTAILSEVQEWVLKDRPSGKKSIDGGDFF